MISLQFSTGTYSRHYRLFLPYLRFNGSSSAMACALQPFPPDMSRFWPQFERKQSAANYFSTSEAPDKGFTNGKMSHRAPSMLTLCLKEEKRKGNSQLSHPFWCCQTLLCRIRLLPEVMIKIYHSVSSDDRVKKNQLIHYRGYSQQLSARFSV